MKLSKNRNKGLDLLAKDDKGYTIRISTGDDDESYQFWLELAAICDKAENALTAQACGEKLNHLGEVIKKSGEG